MSDTWTDDTAMDLQPEEYRRIITRLRTRLGDMEHNADRQTEIIDQVSAQLAEAGRLNPDMRRLQRIFSAGSRAAAERDALALKLAEHREWLKEEMDNVKDARERLAEAQREVELLNESLRVAGYDLTVTARGREKLEARCARLEKIEQAAADFHAKVEQIEASQAYQGVWSMSQIHAGQYQGASWKNERDALKTALAEGQP